MIQHVSFQKCLCYTIETSTPAQEKNLLDWNIKNYIVLILYLRNINFLNEMKVKIVAYSILPCMDLLNQEAQILKNISAGTIRSQELCTCESNCLHFVCMSILVGYCRWYCYSECIYVVVGQRIRWLYQRPRIDSKRRPTPWYSFQTCFSTMENVYFAISLPWSLWIATDALLSTHLCNEQRSHHSSIR